MKKTFLVLCTLAVVLMTGCKKDTIGPDNPEMPVANDASLVGTRWVMDEDMTVPSAKIHVSSDLKFDDLERGLWDFALDILNADIHANTSYTYDGIQGKLTIVDDNQQSATVSFERLDADHLKVSLTPAALLADSSAAAILFSLYGGTLELVYSRWGSGYNTGELDNTEWGSKFRSWGISTSQYDYWYGIFLELKFGTESKGNMRMLIKTTNWTSDTTTTAFEYTYDGSQGVLYLATGETVPFTLASSNGDPALRIEVATNFANDPDGVLTGLMREWDEGPLDIYLVQPSSYDDDYGSGTLSFRGKDYHLDILTHSAFMGSHYYDVNNQRENDGGEKATVKITSPLEFTHNTAFNIVSGDSYTACNIGFFIDQPDGSYDYFDIESGIIQITFNAENRCTLNIEGILGGDSVSMTYSGPINTYN